VTAEREQVTEEEFAMLADPPGKRLELVRGQVIERPLALADQGVAAACLGALLGTYVREQRLGVIFAATGVLLERDPRHGTLARARFHPRCSHHA
jgi:Uma2 family endonuclease